MSEYVAPPKDMQFIFREIAPVDALSSLPGWVWQHSLRSAGSLMETVIWPSLRPRSRRRASMRRTCCRAPLACGTSVVDGADAVIALCDGDQW